MKPIFTKLSKNESHDSLRGNTLGERVSLNWSEDDGAKPKATQALS